MKKLFLFLTVLTFGVSFSSCLKMDNSFTDPYNIVYINEYEFMTKFGKTQTGKLIVNDAIQKMENKSMHLISYSWDEKKNTTSSIGAATAFNVDIIGQKSIAMTSLYTGSHSSESDLFTKVATPVRDEYGIYFDDLWVFEYAFEAIEGQTSSVRFYQRDEDNNDNSNSKKIIKVDVHLSVSGTPGEGKEKKMMGDIVAVDLSRIRSQYVSKTNEEVEIQFFYQAEKDKDPELIKGTKMKYAGER